MDWIITIGGAVLAMIAGGSLSIGALKLDFPGAPLLKQIIISKRDAQVKLSELQSSHIITVIYESIQGVHVAPAKLFHASESALRFYNFAKEEKLVGKTGAELMEILGA
ncbi:MAG: hypothetical protein MN733_30715, partial [Nitrososphaera sp.]|nr:hypothetical protein [Nitrososphaera sp.]